MKLWCVRCGEMQLQELDSCHACGGQVFTAEPRYSSERVRLERRPLSEWLAERREAFAADPRYGRVA